MLRIIIEEDGREVMVLSDSFGERRIRGRCDLGILTKVLTFIAEIIENSVRTRGDPNG